MHLNTRAPFADLPGLESVWGAAHRDPTQCQFVCVRAYIAASSNCQFGRNGEFQLYDNGFSDRCHRLAAQRQTAAGE